MNYQELYRQVLDAEPIDRRRSLPEMLGGIAYLDFSSNDYLGLHRSARLRHAAHRAAARHGMGATGSRLLSGDTPIHRVFERAIARDLGTDAALIFPSGYQLNSTVLSALLDRKVLGPIVHVFTDRFIHASLHHGIHSAGRREIRFRHNDLADLEQRLLTVPLNEPKCIVTESLFGMDGDLCNLLQLQRMAKQYQCLLFVDDAHALGTIGRRGFGATDQPEIDASDPNLILLGTFSKALGTQGGFVACAQTLYEYLLQKCGGFIYSTALAPPLVASAWAAWRELPKLQTERQRLHELATYLRTGLALRGLDHGISQSHILPIHVGTEQRALHVRDTLQEHHILVSAIRPPTVPNGTSRLRIALCSTHTQRDVNRLLQTLEVCL